MPPILISTIFKKNLDSLDSTIREQVIDTLRDIERDPHYSGLRTEKQSVIRDRTIQRSRVNHKYRILWEWIDDAIGLWHVGNHQDIDAIHWIRQTDEVGWSDHEIEEAALTELIPPFETDSKLPFQDFPDNVLRILGVPDESLESVHQITGYDDIWDLSLPENVQNTLLEILTNPRWTAADLLRPEQFLYRTNLDLLEGYTKGKIKKLLLNLTPEQEELVRTSTRGAMLIKGVAGSGKTTIGMYRAHALLHEIQQNPLLLTDDPHAQKILILTYTSTLASVLRQMFIELYGELPDSVIIQHHDEWINQFLLTHNEEFTAPLHDKRQDFVKEAIRKARIKFPEDETILQREPKFFLEEFDDILYGRAIFDLESYQTIRRVGRGISLHKQHREIVWEVFTEYKKLLWQSKSRKGHRYLDFRARPMYIIHKFADNLPKYRAVIVDEAQDLPPAYLQLIAMLTSEKATGMGGLTLLADPAQSIYYRGIPWKEGNIQLQGGNRTHILRKNFRNTVQILKSAELVLDQCDDLKSENEYIPPETTGRKGPRPVLVQYRTELEAMEYVQNAIVQLCQRHHYRLSDIAILMRMRYNPATNQKILRDYEEQLQQHDVPVMQYRDKKQEFDLFHESVKLITMHSAKGLEFPVVFIVGMDTHCIPYITTPENAEEDIRQERKLFYVSMTRASERLFLLYPQAERSPFIHDLLNDTNDTFMQLSVEPQ